VSGATFEVSNADGGKVPVQVSDAIKFIRSHAEIIKRLTASDGVQHAYLDFGWDFPHSSYVQWNSFPPELLQLCVVTGISLCVSVYRASDELSEPQSTGSIETELLDGD
jgi:hypothetical protein